MKIYKHLSEKILTIENFRLAYKNATKGKRHYKEVKEIDKDPETYIQNLLEEVKSKKYVVSDYIVFQLYTGHKWRDIYKLPMKDRIVQHAIMNICEPIFRESFILDTYSSIRTRGTHLGLSRLKSALKDSEYKYCMKLDIHKCYPSLDKEILKAKVARKFNDAFLNWLFGVIIDSCEHGVPIGNYTSQYFNNFYFSDFDHWLKEVKGVKYYFRYCDDMIILGKTKEELHQLLKEIQQKMDELHVHLKPNHQIFPIESRGVDFLGYVSRPKYIRIRKHIKINFVKKVKHMDFEHITEKDINIMGSYWGILVHADCRCLWRKYTGCKNFAEWKQMVHPEFSARDMLNKKITVIKVIVRECSKATKMDMKAIYEGKEIFIHTTSRFLAYSLEAVEEKFPLDIIITPDEFNFHTYKYIEYELVKSRPRHLSEGAEHQPREGYITVQLSS